ncbi:MAG: CPBP family intramembrane metalloprotease [Thermoanaerobaculaceae bacterium]|nr:CPBP family intramembrane metalloprotease [Thermoanaerobaculaceae bacterium]
MCIALPSTRSGYTTARAGESAAEKEQAEEADAEVHAQAGYDHGVQAPAVSKAILALALLVPVPSVAVLLAHWLAPGPVGQAGFALAKLWLVGFPVGWWLLVEKGSWSWSPVRRGGLGAGLLVGVAMAAVIAGTYVAFSQGWLEPAQVQAMARRAGIGTPVRYLAGAAYWVLLNSLIEEIVWRWFVVRQWEALVGRLRGGRFLAVLASAACFTVHHTLALAAQAGPTLVVAGSLGVLAAGATWSWLYLRYRSVWVPWLAHVLADLPIFAIGWHLIFA